MKKKKGFTLVEMIAVIAIIGITGALVFTLFGKTHKVFSVSEKESRNIDEVRLVLSALEEDIKLSDVEPNITYKDETNNWGNITSIDIGGVIIYTYDGKEVRRKDGKLSNNINFLNVVQDEENSKSYKIIIKDNNNIEYQTIVTRRK